MADLTGDAARDLAFGCWRSPSSPNTAPARATTMTGHDRANAKTAALEALIEAHAIELKLPTVRRRFRALAAEATREQQTPVAYLAALLEAETPRTRRAPRAPPPDRRSLPGHQAPRGLPLRRQPQRPASHDRRARRGLLDRRPRERHPHRRLRHRQDAARDRAGRLRLPAGPTRPLHHARRPRQRAPRSPEPPRARPRRRPLRPHRARRPRRARLPRAARRRRRARLPGPLRTPRTRLADRHHQPARSASGPRSSPTPGWPRPSSTASPTRRTSSTPAPSPGASATASPARRRPPRDDAPARPSPLRLALRARLRDDGRAAPRHHASGNITTTNQPTRSGATSGRRGGATASRRAE